MAQTFIQVQPVRLSGSGISATATTITVKSFKDPQGNKIVTADLGDKTHATLEPGSVREEIISFTGVTQNADGTATLTGVTRNLDYTTPYTQISSTGFQHAGNTLLVVSNNPQLYEDLISFSNDETVTGTCTFTNPAFPRIDDTSTPPTADAQFATKKYVDDTAGGAAVSKDSEVIAGTAGETIADNEVVYLKASDQRWWLADASVTATADFVKLGIAKGAGTAGNAIVGGVHTSGLDDTVSGLTAGTVYLSDTAGAMSSSAGTIEVVLGIAESATSIVFDPRFNTEVTQNQKAAMAGTSGTPASGNLFATELGNQLGAENYAVDAAGTDTYVVTLDPVPAAYAAGMTIRVRFGTANTGAATINVNSLGAKDITKNGATALSTGDISANQVATLVYDGTQFQIQSSANAQLTGGGSTTLHSHPVSFTDDYVYFVGNKSDGMTEDDDGGTATITRNPAYTAAVCQASTNQHAALTLDSPFGAGIIDYDNDWEWIASVSLSGTANQDVFWGLGLTNVAATNATDTTRHVGFMVEDGTLYASIADGTTQNRSSAIAGYTLTNYNTYRISFDADGDVNFYINGTLEETLSTNRPAGSSPFRVRFGIITRANTANTINFNNSWEFFGQQ